MRAYVHVHPKTIIETWITCLDPVSANSEKRIGSQWAVRVGQRLQSRFGISGSARKLGLVQIIVEASSIRGGFRNTESCQLVSGWRCRCVLRDYRKWLMQIWDMTHSYTNTDMGHDSLIHEYRCRCVLRDYRKSWL